MGAEGRPELRQDAAVLRPELRQDVAVPSAVPGEPLPPASPGTTVEVADAATVVLVRDGRPDGGAPLEVLLLERHRDIAFAGGALVFPGGRVEDTDRRLNPSRWSLTEPLGTWRQRLEVETDADALGVLVAAVRETFEEAGVLLARREDGTPVASFDLRDPDVVLARKRLTERGTRWDWRGWLTRQRLVLDLDALAAWSWWVTPEGTSKRFDTRFLLAQVPAGQDASPDEVEATSARWLDPTTALEARDRGEALLMFPTRRNLAALAALGDATAVWEAAAAGEVDWRRILPTLVRVDGEVRVLHPDGGDPEPIT